MENNNASTASGQPSEKTKRGLLVQIYTNVDGGIFSGNTCSNKYDTCNNATPGNRDDDDSNNNSSLCNDDHKLAQHDSTDHRDSEKKDNSLTQGEGFAALTPFQSTLIPSTFSSTLTEDKGDTSFPLTFPDARSTLYSSCSFSPSPQSVQQHHQSKVHSSSTLSSPLPSLLLATSPLSLSEDVAICSRMLLPLTGSTLTCTTTATNEAIAAETLTDNTEHEATQDDPRTAFPQEQSPLLPESACAQVALSRREGVQAMNSSSLRSRSRSTTGVASPCAERDDGQDPANLSNAASILSSGCLRSSSSDSSPSLTGQGTAISGDTTSNGPTAATTIDTGVIVTPSGPSSNNTITNTNTDIQGSSIVVPVPRKTKRHPLFSFPPPPALAPLQSAHSTRSAAAAAAATECPTHPAASSFVQVSNLVIDHQTTAATTTTPPPATAHVPSSFSSPSSSSSSSSSSPRLSSVHPLDPSTPSVASSLYPSPPLSDSSPPSSPPLSIANPPAFLAAPIHPFDSLPLLSSSSTSTSTPAAAPPPPPPAVSTTATTTAAITETGVSSPTSWLLHPFRKLKTNNRNTPTAFSSVSAANISSVSFISSNSIEPSPPSTLPPHSLPQRNSSFKHRFRSFSFSNDNPTATTDPSSSPNGDPSFLKRMVDLARNHTMPIVPSGRRSSTSNLLNNTSRSNTTSFAFATITLPKTLSNKSLDGYGHLVTDLPNLNSSRTRSSSSAASGTTGTTTGAESTTMAAIQGATIIPLAPIISAIQRGNFLALSEPLLDVLIRSMAGKNSTTLETISISGAAISASDAKLLARLIRSSDAANIKVLKLARNAISQQAVKYIFEAWKYNQTITCISLSRAGINDKTVKYISKVLTKNETIRELDLSSNRITATGMELLSEAVVYNRALIRLCLQSNNIKGPGAPFLARLLAKNRVLRHLNVGSNGLGSEGCAMIADAVRFNRTLNSLSLDMNEMGPRGATAMAAALVSNRHLTYLYLPHNNIGDQGLAEICESLKRNKSLIGLDLELNNVGYAQSLVGMAALGDVIRTNKTLREINLAYNMFSGDAISELMTGVAVNSTLESINFTNCGISTEGALAIAEVLPSARGLQNLGLTSNPDIAVEGYWALSNGLAKNRSMKGIQLDYNSEDRHVLYEAIQHLLTRNFIWQQAIYAAACRILVLSRVVLLGRPANQMLLQSQLQQQQQYQSSQSKGAWSLLKKKVGLVRTSSSNSRSSILTINKHHTGHDDHFIRSASPLLLAVGSMSRAAAAAGSLEEEQEAGLGSVQNLAHGNRPITPVPLGVHGLGLDVDLGPLGGSSNSNSPNIRRDLHPLVLPHQQQQQLMDQGLLLFGNTSSGSIDNASPKGHPSSTRPSSTRSTSSPHPQHIELYNAHKVLANLANMPYEIFETICAYLDPGHTMNISQIRTTIQVAGDRSTLAVGGGYYTKDVMLERIFGSRYISPFGMRYSVKNGDERA